VTNQLLKVSIYCRCFTTCSEVSLNNHLVLLLVPSCNDEIVLRADEPQELLKPAKREKVVERVLRNE